MIEETREQIEEIIDNGEPIKEKKQQDEIDEEIKEETTINT